MNLIGTKYGKLTILQTATRPGYVICQCECGNVKEIRASSLTKAYKPTRSCGCIQREVAKGVGRRTITINSKSQVETNVQHHTNFQVIENPNLPKNNHSGHKGVWFDKTRNMWEAYLQLHGKRIHLGRYHSYADAAIAREQGEKDYFKPLIESKERDYGRAENHNP